MKVKSTPSLLLGTAILAFAHTATAQDIIKANNTDALNLGTSWVGGSVPGVGNVAVWDSTVTAANSTNLGGATSWQGIRIANPGGAVTINNASADTLTLGGSGIDMTSATQNLTIETNVTTVVVADQTWNVGSGRTLIVSPLTLNSGTTLTVSGSGIVGTGAPSAAGNLIIDGPWFQAWSGASNPTFTGSTTLNSGVIRITSNSSAYTTSTTGTGALILNGGTIASGNTTTRTIPKATTIGGNISIGGSGGSGYTALTNAAFTFSGAVDLGGGTRTLTTVANTTISGAISNGGITKAGTGSLTLSSNANTFSGPITINAGTLTLSGLLGSGSYAGDITNNATFTVNSSGTQTLSGNISGSGALNRAGAGSLTLTGTNTYTGLTTVSGGVFILDGSLTSNISVTTANTRIGGVGTSTGSLTVGTAGTTLGLAGGATTTGLTVNGAVLNGPLAGRFLSAPVNGTTYDVLTYGASGIFNPANLTFLGRGTLNQDTVNNKFTITASAGPETRTWAAGTGDWDATATLTNWVEGDQKFYPFDHAVFPDTASDITVTLTGNVQPSSVTVSHEANTITLGGASITGSSGLSKTGAGTFVLASNHSYTGPTSITAGLFQLGNGGTTGIVSRSSTIDVASGATFQFNRSNSDTGFSNTITGGGTLLKTGGNEFGFTGVNTFSGLIDIQAGKIGLTGVDSENGKPSVNVASGATFSLGTGFDGGICTIGNISGAGNVDTAFGGSNSTRTLEVNQTVDETFTGRLLDASGGRLLAFRKAGPATLTLTATNHTYTGNTTIAAGTLVMPSRSMPTSNFTLADSATLTVVNAGAQLTTGDFTLGNTGTSTLTLQGVATASGLALINCQTLATNGTTTINVDGGYFPVGSHKLISYTSRTGSGGFAVGTLPAGVTGNIVDTGTSINLVVTAFEPLTWNGADNGKWDVDASTNWKLGATTGLKFKNGDVARFDSSAPGSTVVLDGFVEPLVTAFEFDSPKAYTLTGFGGIDTGDLVKSGSGTLTIETNNIHTGTNAVAGGTLVLGNGGALGNAPGGVTVAAGAALDLNGFAVPSGKALSSTGGSLVNSSADSSVYGGAITFASGNSLIGGSGDLTLSAPFSGSGNFVKTGAGTVTTGGIAGDSNSFTGSFIVNEGTLNISSTVRATAGITINPGATASIGRTNMFVTNHGVAMASNRILTASGGTLVMNSSMDARFGNVTLHNGGTFTSNRGLAAYDALFAEVDDNGGTVAGTLAVTGSGVATMNGSGGIHLGGIQNFNIADTTGNPDADLVVDMILDKRGSHVGPVGGVNKTGLGTMRINSNSSYDGATQVTEGTLIVAGSLTATSSVTVASAATLGGNGNIGGSVTIQSGGIHALEVAGEPGQQATRSITGTLTLDTGNVLTLTAATTPASGTYILAVASGGITGTPGTVNLPAGVSGTVAVNGNNLELTVAPAGGDYATWAGSFPGFTDTAKTSDPDNDGLTNFEEYAFGLNPTSGSSVSPVTAPDKTAGTFTYTRRKPSLTGLTYTYESSTTLGGWTAFTPPVADVSNNGDPVETITVTIPAALLAEPKLFLRVEAE
jgi:autotransporter-associated beta strand protein